MKNKKIDKTIFSRYSAELTGLMSVVELHSNHEITVSGCVGVVEYGEENLFIETISGCIRVCGKCLSLDSFQNDILIISGKITSISLEDYD